MEIGRSIDDNPIQKVCSQIFEFLVPSDMIVIYLFNANLCDMNISFLFRVPLNLFMSG
jgi:hypothetical protein